MGKILLISLKLNIAQNTSGSYGLKHVILEVGYDANP